jgi:hypothetical protein
VSHFRVELLNENSVAEVRRVMAMYQPSNGTS